MPWPHPTGALGPALSGWLTHARVHGVVLTDLQRKCHEPGPTECRPLRLFHQCLPAPGRWLWIDVPAADGRRPLRRCSRHLTATPINQPVWQSEQTRRHGPVAASAGLQLVWGSSGLKHPVPVAVADPDVPIRRTIRRPWPEHHHPEAVAVVRKGVPHSVAHKLTSFLAARPRHNKARPRLCLETCSRPSKIRHLPRRSSVPPSSRTSPSNNQTLFLAAWPQLRPGPWPRKQA